MPESHELSEPVALPELSFPVEHVQKRCKQATQIEGLLAVEPGSVTLQLSTTQKFSLTLHIDPEHDLIVLSTPHTLSSVPENWTHPIQDTTLQDTLSPTHDERQGQEITPTPDEITERLRHLYATVLVLPAEQVDQNTDFFNAGGDSLAVVALLAALSRYLDINLDPGEVFDHPTLRDLTAILLQCLSSTRETAKSRTDKKEGIYA